MRLNKQITLVILIVSIIILCNGVSAEDAENQDITGDTTNEDIEQTTVNTNNDLKNMLTNLKRSTKKNHEINLKQNTYNIGKTYTVNINSTYEKNIIINGNHSIIDGQHQTGFLIIPRNAQITINNLTICNMERITGAALRIHGNITLENVNFINNNANDPLGDLGGGAIFTEGFANITNCTFKNNGGDIRGSSIYIKDNINTINQINIKNCSFENNTSNKDSTINILGQTIVNIQDSTFTRENANNSIIESKISELNINNCTFTNENSSNIIKTNSECNINNIQIYNNNITSILDSSNKMILNNSGIYNNRVKYILNYIKNVTIENTVINNNHINESLIKNEIYENNEEQYYTKFTNMTLANNTAKKTCGIKNEYENCYTYIENSEFINNTSLQDEGIISDYYGKMHIYNTHFYNNTAEDLFKGNLMSFKQVTNNEYKGNYLKIYLKTSSTYNYTQLNVNGSLETDKIYNTTVQTGNIILKQENNILYEENITKHNFSIIYPYSNDELNDLKIYYNGVTDFRNTSDDLEVLILNEEYELEIVNVSKTFIYGDYITFDLIIKNSGNIPVNNINYRNILPYELVYVNSSDNFDNENNEYFINTLDINENKTVKFNVTPRKYEDLNLEFNIIDEKQDKTIQKREELMFLKPDIVINKFIAHPGDTVNISTRINNYKKDTIDNVTFSFNYRQVNDFSYKFYDNILTIENYKLSESLTKKNYMIEINCNSRDLEEFSNTSKISVVKYETHSIMNYNLSNSYLNLSIKLLDEHDNYVNGGSLILKVNGKTLKTFIVNEGIVILQNYKLPSNYKNEYNLSITYTGNNKYNLHSNKTYIKEDKKILDFVIDYTINDKIITLSVKTVNDEYILPESGYVAIKINDKTINQKMIIQEEYHLTYDFSDIPTIHSICVAYYGNENFIEKSRTIIVE